MAFLPKFYFQVKIGNTAAVFQEVSGLDIEAQIIEYRHGDRREFSTVKMPGIKKTGNVTLKKGVFVKDTSFWDWYSQIRMNTIERTTVVISLLDGDGNPTMVWTLKSHRTLKAGGSVASRASATAFFIEERASVTPLFI